MPAAGTRLTYPTAVVLYAISRGHRHGFDIIDASSLRSGTVYPILRRLEEARLVRSHWESVRLARDEQRPPRRYYQITGAGERALADANARFHGLSHALAPMPGRATRIPSPA